MTDLIEVDKKEHKDISSEKTYQVKLNLGLSTREAEMIVDKLIMPLLFPSTSTNRREYEPSNSERT